MPPPLLTRHTSAFSRRVSRPSCSIRSTLYIKQGRREGQAPAGACGPRAARKHAAEPQVQAEIARPPLRDGFTPYTCSPRGPALLPPSPARSSHRRLGISTGMPGPHAFDVRTGLFVRADQPRCNPARPPHPASTSVTIAKRPSCEAGCEERTIISEKKKVIFCCRGAGQT
jgi:hypothetical protein